MDGAPEKGLWLEGQAVADYIGANYADPKNKALVDDLILEAEEEICGAVGEGFPRGSARAKLLGKLLCADAYANRLSLNDQKTDGNLRRRIGDIQQQLRLELAAREGEG